MMSPLKQVVIKTRRGFVFAAAVAAIVLPVGAWIVGGRVNENCVGIHRLVRTLDTMIHNSDTQIDKYEKEGLLSPAQADRARREQAENRRLLAGADCN